MSERIDFKKARRKKAELGDPAKVDRLPPHSTEAEQAVLGAILLSPATSMPECLAALHETECFYDLRHRAIWESLLELHARGTAIDLITLKQSLEGRNVLEGAGGLAYVATLPDATPCAGNLGFHLSIVREKHVLRKLIATCTE